MKSCKRGVLCSFYILGADKQDYEYRTSLTHIFRQIGLSLLNLNSQPSLKYFTHRKTKRQKEKIQQYENTKRQYTEPPPPTYSTRLPSQSWIWINPSLKCSPPTTKELVTIFSFFSYANLLADKKYTASRIFFAKFRKCCWRSGISPKNWLSIDIWRSRNVFKNIARITNAFQVTICLLVSTSVY